MRELTFASFAFQLVSADTNQNCPIDSQEGKIGFQASSLHFWLQALDCAKMSAKHHMHNVSLIAI